MHKLDLEDRRKLATKGCLPGFLDAVTVWINKPHVVNRRLCGAKILSVIPADSEDSLFRLLNSKGETRDKGQECDSHYVLEADFKATCDPFILVLRELVPKQSDVFPTLTEIVVYDSSANSFTFCPFDYKRGSTHADIGVSAELTYRFAYTDGNDKSITVSSRKVPRENASDTSHSQMTVQWLCDTLLPKIASWTSEEHLNTRITSLKLVGVDRYSLKYADLKKKYGPCLVQNWSETTDPQKFVYEDIAIATYLLLLWEEEREKSETSRWQTFVDLGCGNGLLVYILTREGHKGVGIDLRRRKIWDMYETDVQLQERPITPSAENLFPEYDWIIGNHSDELTPWIPVIAARSSYTCSYFVLPCCHHDFNRRFNQKKQGESQYRTYLTFVAQAGQVCGFQVEEDILRIPSTKRVCQIGRHRTYSKEEEHTIDRQIQAFINDRCSLKTDRMDQSAVVSNLSLTENNQIATGDADSQYLKRSHYSVSSDGKNCSGHGQQHGVHHHQDNLVSCGGCIHTSQTSTVTAGDGSRKVDPRYWTEGFSTRSSEEPVRNCQQVLQTTKDRVVHMVFKAVMAADNAQVAVSHTGNSWKKGGNIPLSSVVEMLDRSTLQELKSQCGGVQTLLRNHSHIFQVSGGKVQLRDFSVSNPWAYKPAAKARKKDTSACYKTTLCWFHGNHPDGCPRQAEKCNFAHGLEDLRPRVEPKSQGSELRN